MTPIDYLNEAQSLITGNSLLAAFLVSLAIYVVLSRMVQQIYLQLGRGASDGYINLGGGYTTNPNADPDYYVDVDAHNGTLWDLYQTGDISREDLYDDWLGDHPPYPIPDDDQPSYALASPEEQAAYDAFLEDYDLEYGGDNAKLMYLSQFDEFDNVPDDWLASEDD